MMVALYNRGVGRLLLFLAAGSSLSTWAVAAPAVESPLESLGLKQVGSLFLVTTETEVHAKVTEIKTVRKKLASAEARQRAYGNAQDYQQTIKGIGNQISQLRTEMQNVSQQMNRLPRGRRGGYANSVVTEEHNELQMYRNQLQEQVNETTAYLNQLKSHPFDPKTKTRLDAEALESHQTYNEAVVELRGLIDKAQQSYLKLAADETVKKTLYTLGRSAKIAPKLGPSHEFSAAVKMLEKLERETSRSEPSETQTRRARGVRTSFRDLHATKSMS
jgi:hypothetical protein